MFPVEAKLGEIAAALAANRDVVLTAPPGSGKTTCVPPALLDAPWLNGRKIVLLEPRRLAARNCAAFIARKRGEEVGETVGYQVRLERRISARTRLEVVTEGLLAQRLLSDPELADVGLVIFDEFHERALPCDLAFALALEVRRALRPDLRLLVMSATLDADEVAAHLGDATVVRAEGRMFPVETRYLGEVSVAAAVGRALRETDGDVLCFLPGEGEIRRAIESCADLGGGAELLPLYGALPKEEQDRVFSRSSRRKVIFSTSVAETSVTVEGVTAVVDSGLMRVPRFSPGSGMSGLVTLPLTQDRAGQRRGRAGRVRAGTCYRLWPEADQASRPRRMLPEMLDADLASLVLTSAVWGAVRRTDLPWLTPPPASAWDQAVGLLKQLGALDKDGALTAHGEAMARLPMHPRLANMCLGLSHGGRDAETAALLAAILEEGGKSRETDVRRILDEVQETPNRPFSRRILQLARRFLRTPSRVGTGPASVGTDPGAVSEGALLARAYPDRVARNRGNGTFRMVNGRGAFLPEDDLLAREPFLVCCALDDRAGDARIFLACPIAAAEIEAAFSDRIVEEPLCEWDRRADRVRSVVRRRIGELTLGERPDDGDGGERTAAVLDGVRAHGVANLPCWTDESRRLRDRMAFVARVLGTDGGWTEPTDERILSALGGFVGGFSKWRDLDRLDLFQVLDVLLAEDGHDRRELDRLAPPRIEVPSGSHVRVDYAGDEPTAEVRLQECFGMMETPKAVGGRVPIVMTLLSPAQRPVQVTKDLAGFWRGAYQLVRKDLRGRYPKHYWPEDPFTAVATRRTRPPR